MVAIPLLWQAIVIENLLSEQLAIADKAQLEVKQKGAFLRKVCHVTELLSFLNFQELRTPFASIMGYTMCH